MNVRKITPEEVPFMRFTHTEVLNDLNERVERNWKLHKAVALSNVDHLDIGLVVQLDSGEVIETYTSLVDYADDYIEKKGGYFIPLHAVLEIDA